MPKCCTFSLSPEGPTDSRSAFPDPDAIHACCLQATLSPRLIRGLPADQSPLPSPHRPDWTPRSSPDPQDLSQWPGCPSAPSLPPPVTAHPLLGCVLTEADSHVHREPPLVGGPLFPVTQDRRREEGGFSGAGERFPELISRVLSPL